MRNMIKDISQQIIALGPRFADGEERTAKLVRDILDRAKVNYIDQPFPTSVPYPKKAELFVDGQKMECRNVGMTSGTFTSKDALISSLFWGSGDFYYPQNINFNPHSPHTISMATYYKNPALAIRRSDVTKILNAKSIRGETVVEPYTFTGHNFLMGNFTNPRTIMFTHYDCWESGAVDNASGTAVLLDIVLNHAEVLKENLVVIAGNEEISYDEPIYWGKGYRAFQEKYSRIVELAQQILLIDGVGFSKQEWVTDPETVSLGIPLTNFDHLVQKTRMLTGDMHKLMEFYHSNDDTADLLNEESLADAQSIFLSAINSISISAPIGNPAT